MSTYKSLVQANFALQGAVRKRLAGNGRNTDNAAAEAIIAGCIVKTANGQIRQKETVAKLRRALNALPA